MCGAFRIVTTLACHAILLVPTDAVAAPSDVSLRGSAGLVHDKRPHPAALRAQDQINLFELIASHNRQREHAIQSQGLWAAKIPPQLLLTGPDLTITELPTTGLQNIYNTLQQSPHLTVKYLNDNDCRKYLEEHEPELVLVFDHEMHGSYRGDICRASVLLREGGFYVDLDLETHKPLEELIDDSTTFMSARDADGGILNALIATVPQSPIIEATLHEIRAWYTRDQAAQMGDWPMGPNTMLRGLNMVMQSLCYRTWNSAPSFTEPRTHESGCAELQVACGDETIRLYQEFFMGSGDCSHWGAEVCPPQRAAATFDGAKYAIFALQQCPGSEAVQPTLSERTLIGWSRMAACSGHGCGVTGGMTTLTAMRGQNQSDTHQAAGENRRAWSSTQHKQHKAPASARG